MRSRTRSGVKSGRFNQSLKSFPCKVLRPRLTYLFGTKRKELGPLGPSKTTRSPSPSSCDVDPTANQQPSHSHPPSRLIRIVCAKRDISPALSIPSACSSPTHKNILLPFFRNPCFSPSHPASMRGANASSRTRGGEAMDALGSHDERRSRERPSRVVLISRRWDQACG
jgi:hypothetical protein